MDSRMVPAALLRFVPLPPSASSALDALAPSVTAGFGHTFGEPTAAQRLAWPALVGGDNLLLCAPTGTGKTLAAFLPIVSALSQTSPVANASGSALSCLYVA